MLIPLVMLASIAIVITLAYWAATDGRAGFTRRFEAQPLKPLAAIKKRETVVAFAGTRNNQLYFTTTTPAKTFVTDSNLTHGSMQATGFTVSHPNAQTAFELKVTDSSSTLFAGNLRATFTLKGSIADSFNLTQHLFTRVVQIDSGYYENIIDFYLGNFCFPLDERHLPY